MQTKALPLALVLALSASAARAYQYGDAGAPATQTVAPHSDEAAVSTPTATAPVTPSPAKAAPAQPPAEAKAEAEARPVPQPEAGPKAPEAKQAPAASSSSSQPTGAGGAPAAGGETASAKKAPESKPASSDDLSAMQEGQKLFDGGVNRPAGPTVVTGAPLGQGKPSPVGEPVQPQARGLQIGALPSPDGSAVAMGQPGDSGLESWLDAVRRRASSAWQGISDSVSSFAGEVKSLLATAGDSFKRAFMAVWHAPETKSTGSVRSGGLVNGIQLPDSPYYSIINRSETWGAKHMILGLMYIGARISLSGGPTMKVGDISDRNGGQLGGHKSHRRGLDVDIPFFYNRNGGHDARSNYQVLQYLCHNPFMSVEMIFVSPRVKSMLLQQARAANDGALAAWAQGKLLTDEPGHDNHFHVRILEQSKLASWLGGS